MSSRRGSSIAHAGDSNDLAYLRAIADTGAWLGCDRFNIAHFNPDEQRIETLLALLAEGYGDRVHLSHDAACFIDFMVGDPAFANESPTSSTSRRRSSRRCGAQESRTSRSTS